MVCFFKHCINIVDWNLTETFLQQKPNQKNILSSIKILFLSCFFCMLAFWPWSGSFEHQCMFVDQSYQALGLLQHRPHPFLLQQQHQQQGKTNI